MRASAAGLVLSLVLSQAAWAMPAHGQTPEVLEAEVPDPILLDSTESVGLTSEPTPPPRVTEELAWPRLDRARIERSRRNLDYAGEVLRTERGSADLELAVVVNLFVGASLLSVLSVSLVIGTVFEAACIHGVVEECLDGPAFIIGAIPVTLAALALFVGAATADRRLATRYESLDRRDRDLDDRRRELEPTWRVSLGAGSIAMSGSF